MKTKGIMKTIERTALVAAITLGALLSAEVKKEETKPKPQPPPQSQPQPAPLATELSADEKAAYGSQVATLLNIRLRREQMERKATEEVPGLTEARKEAAAVEKEFNLKLAELQKKHNAPGCMISLDYKWLDAAGEPCHKAPQNTTAKK